MEAYWKSKTRGSNTTKTETDLDRVNGDKGRRYLDIFVGLSGVSSIPARVLCLALRFFLFSSFQGFVVRTNF